MAPPPVRFWASAIVNGRLFSPAVVPTSTVVANENVLLPPSMNDCATDPPMALRSALTARPVLVGFVPGVTTTASVTGSPGAAAPGVDAPTPVGLVGVAAAPSGVME